MTLDLDMWTLKLMPKQVPDGEGNAKIAGL
jgi:hypothetical protein